MNMYTQSLIEKDGESETLFMGRKRQAKDSCFEINEQASNPNRNTPQEQALQSQNKPE